MLGREGFENDNSCALISVQSNDHCFHRLWHIQHNLAVHVHSSCIDTKYSILPHVLKRAHHWSGLLEQTSRER